MLLVKQSYFNPDSKNPADYINGANTDLNNIFNAFKGRIRFGDGKNGSRGENISGNFAVFTSHATPNTEFPVTLSLGYIPMGWIVVNKNKAGDLYAGTTTWTNDTIYLKSTGSSVDYITFLLK